MMTAKAPTVTEGHTSGGPFVFQEDDGDDDILVVLTPEMKR